MWRTPGGGGVFVLARNRTSTVHRKIDPFIALCWTDCCWTKITSKDIVKFTIDVEPQWTNEVSERRWYMINVCPRTDVMRSHSRTNCCWTNHRWTIQSKNNPVYRSLLNVRLTWKIITKNAVIFDTNRKISLCSLTEFCSIASSNVIFWCVVKRCP